MQWSAVNHAGTFASNVAGGDMYEPQRFPAREAVGNADKRIGKDENTK
jgi:hypothetical protein